MLLYCTTACFEAFFFFYYHDYCHKSRGQSERHGTHTNFNETESASHFCEVHGQEFHMQMIYSMGEKEKKNGEQDF